MADQGFLLLPLEDKTAEKIFLMVLSEKVGAEAVYGLASRYGKESYFIFSMLSGVKGFPSFSSLSCLRLSCDIYGHILKRSNFSGLVPGKKEKCSDEVLKEVSVVFSTTPAKVKSAFERVVKIIHNVKGV